MSIMGRGLYRRLRCAGIGFGVAGILGSILLVAYCVMVGNSISTVRAVGMMLVFFLAQWIGRSYDMLNALGGMMLGLLWDNPFLIENNGFWFSVMALLGVGVVGKEFADCKQKNMQGFWMSLGITMTTLPVTALSYYEVPLYSPLVNFLVLPLLTPVFCLAVLVGLLGILLPALGILRLLLYPCQWLLFFYEWICKIVAKLPGASVICGKPEWWQVVMYYGILFGGVFVIRILRTQQKRTHKDVKRTLLLSVVFISCSLWVFFPKFKDFEISFLDVGQGDGIYICAGDGTTCFIDGGSSSVNGVGENRILPFLKAKGVRGIDYWFVSHTDTDHISGLLEVLERGYQVEHLVVAKHCPKDEKYEQLVSAAEENRVTVFNAIAEIVGRARGRSGG